MALLKKSCIDTDFTKLGRGWRGGGGKAACSAINLKYKQVYEESITIFKLASVLHSDLKNYFVIWL